VEGRHRRFAGSPPDPEAEDREAEDGGTEVEDPEAEVVIEIVGIDHVQLSMPPGAEEEARRFYGSVLGLREVAKPPELVGRGGCWFVGADAAIHLAREEGFRPHVKAHPALVIRDLAAARDALGAAGVLIEEDDSGLLVRRCYIRDPFGNRIELVDARDAGFSAV
jgi:catechol 2,3-dioxygenase-like lactoylglutathione lyase family enzyme